MAETYEQIIQDIIAQLNGDYEHDSTVLIRASEEHRKSEFGQEVARECGRMLFELLPEDKRAEIDQAVAGDALTNGSALNEGYRLLTCGKPEEALVVLEPYAKEIKEAYEGGTCKDDSVSCYFDFDNMLEYLMIVTHEKPEKEVRQAILPFANTFSVTAAALYEVGRYGDAVAWLERAIKWNPVRPGYYLEIAENYKRLGNLELVDEWDNAAYPYIIDAPSLAKWYRSKGYVSIEQKNYELAAAEFLMSLVFEANDFATSELMYMKMECDADYTEMEIGDAVQVLRDWEIPVGPTEENLGLLYQMVKIAMDNDDKDMAIYCASQLVELTADDQLEAEFDELLGDCLWE